MLKALIVDDEAITRNGLINHINWDKFNIDSISTASSGRDGIDYMKNNHIDIVISDVCMPGMTGIEMCGEIKKIAPHCQIIFLSGYSDKEYLMGAIELEAVSYVEKPIQIAEVEGAIEKAVNKISNNEHMRKAIDMAIEESREMMTQVFLQKLIKGKLNVVEIKEQVTRLGLDLLSINRFSVAIFKCKSEEEELDRIVQYLEECMVNTSTIYCITEHQHIVFLIGHRDNDEDKVRTIYNKIKNAVETTDYRIYGSFGLTVSSILKVQSSYDSAKKQLQQLFFKGYGHMSAGVTNNVNEDKISIDDRVVQQLDEALTKYDRAMGEQLLADVYNKIDSCRNANISYAKAIYFRIIECIIKAAETFKTSKEETNEAEIVSFIMEKLDTLDTLSECHEYARELMEEYLEDSKDFANNSRVIIDIIEYIKNNYSNPYLCLGDIADSVYMTPNYMNGLFKKKFGTTVGQYITNVRIESAKELIMDRSIKLSEVASMVGYNDPGYFTKAFRKNVGMSPKDFRDR